MGARGGGHWAGGRAEISGAGDDRGRGGEWAEGRRGILGQAVTGCESCEVGSFKHTLQKATRLSAGRLLTERVLL